MRILMIVARDSMLSDLEEFLQKNGVNAYTIVNKVTGKGMEKRVYGTFLNPDINDIIFAVLEDEEAAVAINALQSVHEKRKEASHDDQHIPLKVFSFSCNEHV